MNIIYKIGNDLSKQDLMTLYSANEWALYTIDIDKLYRAVMNSLFVRTAWDNDKLVGLVRIVGDGESIIYIQDILVLPSYHRKGIGTVLMKDVLERFQDVRQKVLLTGRSEKQDKFYRSLGFVTPIEIECSAFVRHDL
jgi:GNAT superfamily N-acetyltransferase